MKKSSNPRKKSLRKKMFLRFILIALALLLFQMRVHANETYDYVIITTNAIDSLTIPGGTILNPFIVHKEKMGFSVRTVTETIERSGIGHRETGDYGYGTEGSTKRAENIRNWLIDHYQRYGIKYVLLIGDPHPWVKPTFDTIYPLGLAPTSLIEWPLCKNNYSLPMKVCYLYNNRSHPFPTDYYFSELTGNFFDGEPSLPEGIVGHWILDQAHFDIDSSRFLDQSGLGHHAILVKSDPNIQPEFIEKALKFDYVNGKKVYLELPKDESGKGILSNPNNFGTSGLTLTFRVRVQPDDAKQWNVLSSGCGPISYISYGKENPSYAMIFGIAGDNYDGMEHYSTETKTEENPELLTGEWIHITFVLEPGIGYSYYFDGNLVKTKSASTITLSNYNELFYIGHHAGYGFKGLISEVKLWNIALSDEEVIEEFNSQAQKFDYLIITTNAVVEDPNFDMLDTFITHKENMGFKVITVTQTKEISSDGTLIGSGYGTEFDNTYRADAIRDWLVEHYHNDNNFNIKYVLLIGDPHPLKNYSNDPNSPSYSNPLGGNAYSIPMKACYLYNGAKLCATDIMYADLDSILESDGPYTVPGEFYEDYSWTGNINFRPEVYVGRIPVYSEAYIQELSDLLRKIIIYETTEDTDYRESFLYAQAHAFWDGNTEFDEQCREFEIDFANEWEEEYLEPFRQAGYQYYRMYQQAIDPNPPYHNCMSKGQYDEVLTNGNFIYHWKNKPYGLIHYHSHGLPRNSYLECGEGNLIDISQLQNFDDGNYPAIVVQGGCMNGFPYYPNDKDGTGAGYNNLQYELLKNGSICNLAWTTGGYPDIKNLFVSFFQRMVNYDMTVGEAIYLAKAENITSIMYQLQNIYNITLYGDPSISLKPVKTPVNLKATQTGLKKVVLTWVDNCTNENHFHIYRKAKGDLTWTLLNEENIEQNSTKYIDDTVESNKEYFFRVDAVDSTDNVIGSSNVASFVTGSTVDFRPFYVRRCLDINNKAEVRFTDKSDSQFGEIVGREWDFGDGTTSNEQNPTHLYTKAGAFDVTLTIISQDSKGTCMNQKIVQDCVYIENSDNLIGSYIDPNPDIDGDYTGLWIRDMKNDGQYMIKAVWSKVKGLTYMPDMIAAGDMDGDGYDEVVGHWSEPKGIWSYDPDPNDPNVVDWERIYYDGNFEHLVWIAVGDLNGGGKDDLVGSWENDIGVWVKYSENNSWEQLHASPAKMITTGDIDGDGADDLIGKWENVGIWVRYATGSWEMIKNAAEGAGVVYMGSGDMDGDKLDDIVLSHEQAGTWVRYSDSNSNDNTWKQLDERVAYLLTTGNLDDDKKDDPYIVLKNPQSIDGIRGIWGWSSYLDKTIESRQRFTPQAPICITTGNVYPNPSPVTADFKYSINGLTVNFTSTSSTTNQGGELQKYEWDFGDGNASSGQNAEHTYVTDEDSTYTVTLTVTDNFGDTDTVFKDVTITVE